LKNRLSMSLAGLSLMCSTAIAGTMGDIAIPTGHWLIGGDVGYGYLSTTEPFLLPVAAAVTNVIPDTLVQRRRLGNVVGGGYVGYEFPVLERLFMGMEVGYKYAGQSKYFSRTSTNIFEDVTLVAARKHVKVTQQAVDFLLTSKVHLSPHVHLFGKAGAAYVRSQTKERSRVEIANDFAALDISPAMWRIRPEFDLGVGYGFNDKLSVNLTYTFIGGADANVTGLFRFYNVGTDSTPAVFQYNALTAGLSYTFG